MNLKIAVNRDKLNLTSLLAGFSRFDIRVKKKKVDSFEFVKCHSFLKFNSCSTRAVLDGFCCLRIKIKVCLWQTFYVHI